MNHAAVIGFYVILATFPLPGQQSQFQGSVPMGAATSGPIPLTLQGAIGRGLQANLGLLVSDSGSEIARGQRIQALSALLPSINGQISQTEEQINLSTIGFNFSFPGVPIPRIVGPFHYTDARAYASWSASIIRPARTSGRRRRRLVRRGCRCRTRETSWCRRLPRDICRSSRIRPESTRFNRRWRPRKPCTSARTISIEPERCRASTFCVRRWN